MIGTIFFFINRFGNNDLHLAFRFFLSYLKTILENVKNVAKLIWTDIILMILKKWGTMRPTKGINKSLLNEIRKDPEVYGISQNPDTKDFFRQIL
ncbi:unnamed protein product [Rhizophagus irregularis]|nr:unnamed protein product [Rhizophagus irregularis]